MIRKMSKTITLAAAMIFVQTLYSGNLDLSGYFENRFFLIDNHEVPWDNIDEKFALGDYNRLRLRLKSSPSEKVTVNVAVDMFSFHGVLTSPLGTYQDEPESEQDDNAWADVIVDRAYVDLYFKKVDLSVGKQRLAIGVSYLWAPLDIFNRVNVLEPKEEKPGTNALKVYLPLASTASVTAIFSPDDKFSSSKSGLRTGVQLGKVDLGLTIIRDGLKKRTVYGIDLRGENLIGWWIEGGVFSYGHRTEKKLVLGFDYTFPIKDGLYWLNEFFYDSGGEKETGEYDFDLLLSGERFTLGQYYYFSMLRYSFSDFTTASFSYIGNWGDGSFLLNPSLQVEISQNILISTGLYLPMGKKLGELNRNGQSLFYLWLKINF